MTAANEFAGDLHFYMRHSFRPYQPQMPAPSQTSSRSASFVSAHQESSPQAVHVQASSSGQKDVPVSSKAGKPGGKGQAAAAKLPKSQPVNGKRSPQPTVRFEQHAVDSSATSTASDEVAVSQLEDAAPSSATTAGWHPYDPEHLIVNGLGGAFLHPTHVFTPSRFISVPDPSADEATVTNTRPTANTALRGRSPPRGSSPRGSSPVRRSSPRGASPASSFAKRISLAAADQGVITAQLTVLSLSHILCAIQYHIHKQFGCCAMTAC